MPEGARAVVRVRRRRHGGGRRCVRRRAALTLRPYRGREPSRGRGCVAAVARGGSAYRAVRVQRSLSLEDISKTTDITSCAEYTGHSCTCSPRPKNTEHCLESAVACVAPAPSLRGSRCGCVLAAQLYVQYSQSRVRRKVSRGGESSRSWDAENRRRESSAAAHA